MKVTKETNRILILRMLDRHNIPSHCLRSLTGSYYRLDVADINGMYFTKYAKFSICFRTDANPFTVERQIAQYESLAKR